MADEKSLKNTKEASEKKGFLSKTVSFFKTLPGKIAQPFMSMWRELKKVTWPSRQDLLNYTLIVLAFMAFMGVVIGLLDLGASKLIAMMIGNT